MTPLEELRSIGSFSGAMFKVLEDFDARLKAVEAHKPMLEEATRAYNEHMARLAENMVNLTETDNPDQQPPALPDAATSDSVGTGVESLDVPGGIATSATQEPSLK